MIFDIKKLKYTINHNLQIIRLLYFYCGFSYELQSSVLMLASCIQWQMTKGVNTKIDATQNQNVGYLFFQEKEEKVKEQHQHEQHHHHHQQQQEANFYSKDTTQNDIWDGLINLTHQMLKRNNKICGGNNDSNGDSNNSSDGGVLLFNFWRSWLVDDKTKELLIKKVFR